jgi:hypothetical protein
VEGRDKEMEREFERWLGRGWGEGGEVDQAQRRRGWREEGLGQGGQKFGEEGRAEEGGTRRCRCGRREEMQM